MAFRPQPYTLKCTKCHWRKNVAPTSDVIMPGDMPNECPKCGCTDVRCEPMSSGGVLEWLTAISKIFTKH
jgi:NAD-dependent SIR2 family protein deacetylase